MSDSGQNGVFDYETPWLHPQIGAAQRRNMARAAVDGVLVVTRPADRNACLRLSDRGYMLRLPNAPKKTDWYALTEKGRKYVKDWINGKTTDVATGD